jgi:serine/threonine protein kinase
VDAIDLVSKMLVYEPDKRIKPIDALLHPFFDDLRDEGVTFPNGNYLPDLFNFSRFEIHDVPKSNLKALIP